MLPKLEENPRAAMAHIYDARVSLNRYNPTGKDFHFIHFILKTSKSPGHPRLFEPRLETSASKTLSHKTEERDSFPAEVNLNFFLFCEDYVYCFSDI
jgi:hypothetical protein